MPFDIYGQPLRKGHCEVHPDVWGEYPCSVCMMEAQQAEEARRYEEAMREQWEQDMAEQAAEAMQGMHGDGI